jgi:glycogen debranching enzyme
MPLPGSLEAAMRENEKGLEALWDPATESYYSRDTRAGNLIREQTIAALMPLYAGCIDTARAKRLASMLADPGMFGTAYPIPTVPPSSHWFKPVGYWQGPAWINMNWLVIDGLRRYGFTTEAEALRLRTLELVRRSGFYEYYNPLSGEPAGAKNFSWTAALFIDLLPASGQTAHTASG